MKRMQQGRLRHGETQADKDGGDPHCHGAVIGSKTQRIPQLY